MDEDKSIIKELWKLKTGQPFRDIGTGRILKKLDDNDENAYWCETEYAYEYPDDLELCQSSEVELILEKIPFVSVEPKGEFYFTIDGKFRLLQKTRFPLQNMKGELKNAYCWETGDAYFFEINDMVERIQLQ